MIVAMVMSNYEGDASFVSNSVTPLIGSNQMQAFIALIRLSRYTRKLNRSCRRVRIIPKLET